MAPGSGKIHGIRVHPVDQQPVRFYVCVAVSFPLACKRMVTISGRDGKAVGQQPYQLFQPAGILSQELLQILLEGGGKILLLKGVVLTALISSGTKAR